MKSDPEPIDEIVGAARDAGLIGKGEQVVIAPLSGGVSCDVFRLEVNGRPALVAKRALPKLRVAADWRAPVERSQSEVSWLRLVAKVDRRLVPGIVAEDRPRHLFFMEYLPKEQFPVWKDQLAAGDVDIGFAASVGGSLARIHAFTAGSDLIAKDFAHQKLFVALRLDPYILEAAHQNPDVAHPLNRLAEGINNSRIALMQGDISPKNILHGHSAPVFVDAETASYGDPAFDLAFCLNHLLLKCVWHPEHLRAYGAAFSALKDSYLADVIWERPEGLDARAGAIIAGLLLARIDGKSPVEYITEERRKSFVRERAKEFLLSPRVLSEVLDTWLRETELYFAASDTR
jgi:5-methylthioribose kinase